MTDDWLDLDPGESVEWDARPRLMRALPAVVVSVLLLAGLLWAALTVDTRLAIAVVVVPLPAVYGYLRVVNTRFVVTNRAVYRKRGIAGIEVRTIELDRVQNTQSTQGVLGTAFGYGTVEIEVAGGPDLRLYDIYDPDDVRRLIEGLGGTRRKIPGSVEQWRAVRAELRAIRRELEDQPT